MQGKSQPYQLSKKNQIFDINKTFRALKMVAWLFSVHHIEKWLNLALLCLSNQIKKLFKFIEIKIYSLQLNGCTVLSPLTKNCPLIRGVHFLENWAMLDLFSKIYYFYTYIWGNQGKWNLSRSFWTKKRKKEMMLNFCNLKCFKVKYQLIKSIMQTLFYHKIIIDMALLFVQHSYLL